jgi:hypothetical protein
MIQCFSDGLISYRLSSSMIASIPAGRYDFPPSARVGTNKSLFGAQLKTYDWIRIWRLVFGCLVSGARTNSRPNNPFHL